MESQALRERFFDFLDVIPHQKFFKVLLRQQLFGIKKELIAKVGITTATDLIKTSLPAYKRVLALHPSILLCTLSIMP